MPSPTSTARSTRSWPRSSAARAYECLVCGEFLLHAAGAHACPECGTLLCDGREIPESELEFVLQAG